jgi:hypothetical protein
VIPLHATFVIFTSKAACYHFVSFELKMNKAALITVVKKFQAYPDLCLVSIFDLEPSGIIVHAYNQINSNVYTLPVSEMEVR